MIISTVCAVIFDCKWLFLPLKWSFWTENGHFLGKTVKWKGDVHRSAGDHWMTIEWPLSDHRMTIEWPSDDHWVTIGWSLSDHCMLGWPLDGHWMVILMQYLGLVQVYLTSCLIPSKWPLDGHRMTIGWLLDGHWMAIGWAFDE